MTHRLNVVGGPDECAGQEPLSCEMSIIRRAFLQPFLVHCISFGKQYYPVYCCILRKRRELDFLDGRPQVSQHIGGMVYRISHFLLRVEVFGVEMPNQSDSHSLDALVNISSEVFSLGARTCRVARIVSGDNGEHDRIVFNRSRQGTNIVEAEGQRDDSGSADPSVGCFNTRETTDRRRVAH